MSSLRGRRPTWVWPRRSCRPPRRCRSQAAATSRAGKAAGSAIPQIVSGGSGYNGSETLSVSGTGTSGALSHITTNGVITSVWVSTRGSGYTGAVSVSVSGGSGSGASITLQSESLPVASMDVHFQPGPGGTSYVSTLHLSNRRAKYTSEMFVRPRVRGQQLGGAPLGAGYGAGWGRAVGGTDFSGGMLGVFNEAASGNQGAAAIPEIASLGLTPREQAAAKERQDQDFERNLLESSGSGPRSDAAAIRAENKFMEGRRREVARAEREAPDAQYDERRARADEHASGASSPKGDTAQRMRPSQHRHQHRSSTGTSTGSGTGTSTGTQHQHQHQHRHQHQDSNRQINQHHLRNGSITTSKNKECQMKRKA